MLVTEAANNDNDTAEVGDRLRAARAIRATRPRNVMTSLVLDDRMVGRLREKARRRRIGYQALLKLIVAEHLDEY
jgi:hypothetical protein